LIPTPSPEAKALIVGAAGQVGAAIASVLGAAALPTGRQPSSDGSPFLDLVALAHNPALAAEFLAPLSLSAVYCVGGATDVERCEADTAWAMDTNCHGPAALAAAARHLPFVYFSTDYVFDGREAPGHPGGPYTETDPTHALSVYGRSKLEGEQRIRDAHPNPLIVRTNVVYGPDRQQKNFLYTLRRLLNSGQTMRVPSDQISTPTYNADLARATVALMQASASGIFNICGPELLSRYDFALLAASILGLDSTLLSPVTTAELNQRAPRPLHAGLLTEKLRATLGPSIMRSNAQAIADWSSLTVSAVPAGDPTRNGQSLPIASP
jgi:dTDP-4-dehydrorhamnose reductase